ncbi:hypothetical protein [Pseudomonas knackmussii]|uniref:hypothetical protein n=1 Tax=Pseudomonas knackmussii TaxID=65741 RepID=UPI003F4A7648
MLKSCAFALSVATLFALGGCAAQSSYNLGSSFNGIESPVKESFGIDSLERQPGHGAQLQDQSGFSTQQQQMLMLQ